MTNIRNENIINNTRLVIEISIFCLIKSILNIVFMESVYFSIWLVRLCCNCDGVVVPPGVVVLVRLYLPLPKSNGMG